MSNVFSERKILARIDGNESVEMIEKNIEKKNEEKKERKKERKKARDIQLHDDVTSLLCFAPMHQKLPF